MVKSTKTLMKLDAEDREWLGGLFKHIDDRFAQIDDRFAQIDDRFAQIDNRFAQIDDRFAQIDDRFAKVDDQFARMDDRFRKLESSFADDVDRLDAKIEQTETTLLTEFHKWASPVAARLRMHTAAFRAIELEIEALADRVTKLEQTRPN